MSDDHPERSPSDPPGDRHPEGHTDLHPHDRADRPGTGPPGPPPGGSVVVGVDGSGASRAALAWAIRYAAASRSRVLAVTAWREPVQTSAIGAVGRGARRTEAESRLDDAVRGVPSNGAQVDRAVELGRADEVLVRRSQDADLLVLGNHRRGPFGAVGSVAQDCLRRAACPVVVVPSG